MVARDLHKSCDWIHSPRNSNPEKEAPRKGDFQSPPGKRESRQTKRCAIAASPSPRAANRSNPPRDLRCNPRPPKVGRPDSTEIPAPVRTTVLWGSVTAPPCHNSHQEKPGQVPVASLTSQCRSAQKSLRAIPQSPPCLPPRRSPPWRSAGQRPQIPDSPRGQAAPAPPPTLSPRDGDNPDDEH